MIPEGYRLGELAAEDASALAAAYRRNREHLEPWEPDRDEHFYTDDGQASAVAGQLAAASSGLLAAWLLWRGNEVVGRVNLNNIVMGVLRSASVGYWVAADHVGRGLASGAVEFVCAQAQGRGWPGPGEHDAPQRGVAGRLEGLRLRVHRHGPALPVHRRSVAGSPAVHGSSTTSPL